MPIWAIDPIERWPQVTLESWAVLEVPLKGIDQPWTRHLVGYAIEDRQGQVSSPVIQFDPKLGPVRDQTWPRLPIVPTPQFERECSLRLATLEGPCPSHPRSGT